ncbi:MAG TPA: hypothetical protein VFI23_10595 [Rhizomicrobium sp.]|nr:hypothetical protein [Rhizomicrobium sp.]
MIRKILFCGFLLLTPGLVLAQGPSSKPTSQPSPSPSPPKPEPKPGDRAYTEARLKDLSEAQKAYEADCDSSADLNQLDNSHTGRSEAAMKLIRAMTEELRNTNRPLREAVDNLNIARDDLVREQAKGEKADYVKLVKLDETYHKQEEATIKLYDDALDKLIATVDLDGVLDRGKAPCARHQKLIDARRAEADKKNPYARLFRAQAEAEREKRGLPHPGTCYRGTGIIGALDKETCEMNKK